MKVHCVVFSLLLQCICSVPIIDVFSLYDSSASVENVLNCVSLIDDALQKYGVFVAIGHPMDSHYQQYALHAASNLFALSSDMKSDIGVDSGGFMRGFIGFGYESGLQNKYFEPKEGFSYGYEWTNDTFKNKLQGRNKWPPEKNEYNKIILQDVFDKGIDMSKRIISAISMALFGSKSALDGFVSEGETISIMRLFHYFTIKQELSSQSPQQTPSSSSQQNLRMGSSPHTDWGLLTLILQDGVGGLQFLHRGGGGWQDVPVVPGGIVVNGGDFLSAVMSTDRYHSPVHRVLCPTGEENRISFVLFFYPNYDVPVDGSLFSSGNKSTSHVKGRGGGRDEEGHAHGEEDGAERGDADVGRSKKGVLMRVEVDHQGKGVEGVEGRGAGAEAGTGGDGEPFNTLISADALCSKEEHQEKCGSASVLTAASDAGLVFGDLIYNKWKGVVRG